MGNMDLTEFTNVFNYVYSSTVQNKFQIKIGTLEGKRQKPEYDKILSNPLLKYSGMCQEGCSDLKIVCQIFDEGKPLTLSLTTTYKSFTTRWSWNEWLSFPISFSDLPKTAQLAFTIYDCLGPASVYVVGGATISIFNKYGQLREGILDLKVWPNQKADGNKSSTTPGNIKSNDKEKMTKLSKLAKKHRNGHISKVDWLDRLTFRELEIINDKEKNVSDYLYLMIEFPTVFVNNVMYHIVYFEPNGEDIHTFRSQADIVTVPDQEILRENLVERKHHKLARSLRVGYCDKEVKPNAELRNILNTMVSYPSTKQLSNEEQDHVWKFRFYLSTNKKALTKFLKCVNWTQPNEVKQALGMMKIWTPMDVEDALELLSPNFSHPLVRIYAITRLQQAPDEEILLYLLQLVQALKYENFKAIEQDLQKIANTPEPTSNVKQQDAESVCLLPQSTETKLSGVLKNVESLINSALNENDVNTEVTPVHSNSESSNATTATQANSTLLTTHSQSKIEQNMEIRDLATFLIQRACKNFQLANYFYWYLLIECEDPDSANKEHTAERQMYLNVMKLFCHTLETGTIEMQKRRNLLTHQHKFVDNVMKLMKCVLRENGNRKRKIEKLQQILSEPSEIKFNFKAFDPIPLPLDPDILITGVIAETATLFKSALMPSKLHFNTVNSGEYVAIFKYGDDLRQDQLILQMITLMDKLLRKENLDLKLTPYRVLATSTKHGFVQFIESTGVADALATDGTLQNFFRKHHPCDSAPYGISPDVMDNYVRSCAGYCIITYLLSVGDRHLDNLLLTPCGKLFHIDFGYILGRDPKPLPPPMKLSKEMVEAMGGIHSEHYQEFRKQCYTSFLHLRRHANLMLNLFSLMVDASVPDIALEPDKAVRKVQDKFRLDLGEEEAVQYIQNLIDSSVTAVMPAIVEQFHKITQYIRK